MSESRNCGSGASCEDCQMHLRGIAGVECKLLIIAEEIEHGMANSKVKFKFQSGLGIDWELKRGSG